MKVLVIGPSPTKSKGGMATVIEEIAKDQKLNKQFDIDIYESYIDGNKLKVLLFSAISFIRFSLSQLFSISIVILVFLPDGSSVLSIPN